jgi:hypothetical protein
MLKARAMLLALAAAVVLAGAANAADLTASLTKGTPELKSAGPLAFGPEGILFVGDPQAATIFAIATEDTKKLDKAEKFKVSGVNEKIANMLGVDTKAVTINDMAANPISGNLYFSVTRNADKPTPIIVRVDPKGKISEFPLKDVKFSKVTFSNAPKDAKDLQESITQIAFVKDHVYVAGLSNEDWKSTLRSIPFPFKEADKGAGIEIWHGSHGGFETKAPVRTFVAYDIKGETNLLAAYTCTPLVKIPISQLKPGEKVKGTTVAELGNGNKPLNMIVYEKGGKEYLLLANSKRGVMKIPTEGLADAKAVTEKVSDKAGVKYETVADLKDVQHLDKYSKELAVVLVGSKGTFDVEVIDLP